MAFQHEEVRGDGLDELSARHIALRLPFFRQLTMQQSLLEVLTGLGGLAVVVTGAVLTTDGAIDPGVLPLLTLLAMAAFLPVSEIAQVGRQLADTLGATRRIYALEREPIPVEDGPGVGPDSAATAPSAADGTAPSAPNRTAPSAPNRAAASAPNRTAPSAPNRAAAMDLDGVGFAYPGQARDALADVDMAIPAGQVVALVGTSGAGKTTTAFLLMRFWDPDRGEVATDDIDLRQYRLDELRDRIALVAQDTYLFNDSLRANILIGRPDASEAELAAAVEQASLGELVDSLPDGLDTVVGERGTSLSGGQRQRVAIARAFLKDAPVLILDEATSHLDAVNEHVLRRSLAQLQADRTTVVIAHRLSTVRHADRIVVLDEGRVVETGAHDELLARNGLYAQLVSRQLASAAAP